MHICICTQFSKIINNDETIEYSIHSFPIVASSCSNIRSFLHGSLEKNK